MHVLNYSSSVANVRLSHSFRLHLVLDHLHQVDRTLDVRLLTGRNSRRGGLIRLRKQYDRIASSEHGSDALSDAIVIVHNNIDTFLAKVGLD